MILTIEEFAKAYKLSSVQGVHRIIREKKVFLNADKMIDTNDERNVDYCEARLKRIEKQANKEPAVVKEKKEPKNQKSADQLALEIDLLNARLEEKQQNSELKKIQIAKAKKEVIETDVLNRCIQAIFGDMIKNLTELPNIYVGDIIKTVKTEEEPKEYIVEFLTQKISATIKQGLESAKTATKKYYEGGE